MQDRRTPAPVGGCGVRTLPYPPYRVWWTLYAVKVLDLECQRTGTLLFGCFFPSCSSCALQPCLACASH